MCCPHGQAYLQNPEFDYDDYIADPYYEVPGWVCQDHTYQPYQPEMIDSGALGRR